MFVTMKKRTGVKAGHVRSKARSFGQIFEKSCVLSSRHSFDAICLKLCQNVCHNEILDKFESGLCRVKNRSLDQFLEKLCIHSRGHSFDPNFMKLVRMFIAIKSRSHLKMGSIRSKSRS